MLFYRRSITAILTAIVKESDRFKASIVENSIKKAAAKVTDN